MINHIELRLEGAQSPESEISAAGRMGAVDLRSHKFRLRDDVGHNVDLRQVADDEGVDLAEEFIATKVVSREEILASAPGPDPAGSGIERTNEEFDVFLEAIRR